MPMIEANALRQARSAKGWSQEDLAERTKIDKGTISRLERSEHSTARNRTLDQLCGQLGVTREMLTGEVPLPTKDAEPPAWMNISQLNIRIGNDARNALALVSSRYGVPQSSIVELAPFLFHCAAEMCLKQRAARVAELEEKYRQIAALKENFPHLSPLSVHHWKAEEIMDGEKSSIEAHELFFTDAKSVMPIESLKDNYEDYFDSPFVKYLSEMARQVGDETEFQDWSGRPTYQICQNEALSLVNNDSDAALGVLTGMAPLHEMPKELRRRENLSDRVQWIKQHASEAKNAFEEVLGTPDDLVGTEAKEGGNDKG